VVREPRPSENNPTAGDQLSRIGRAFVNIKRQEKMKGVKILSAPFLTLPLIDEPNLTCSRTDVLR